MKRNGTTEPVRRYYNSLANFVGENKVYPKGDMLHVSTKNNDVYDLVLTADGKLTFTRLYRKYKEGGGSGGDSGESGDISVLYDRIVELERRVEELGGKNSIGSEEIKDGSIRSEDLSEDVRQGLEELNNPELTEQDLEDIYFPQGR